MATSGNLFGYDAPGEPTPEDKAFEARVLIGYMLNRLPRMDKRERDFVSDTIQRLADYGLRAYITDPQLEWLRDLKEKYL